MSVRAETAVERTDASVDAAREFLSKQVPPDLKPALLSALDEVKDVVDTALNRAKKALKDL